jgi:hypothetical protein
MMDGAFLHCLRRELLAKGCSSTCRFRGRSQQRPAGTGCGGPQYGSDTGGLVANLKDIIEQLGSCVYSLPTAEQDDTGDVLQ